MKKLNVLMLKSLVLSALLVGLITPLAAQTPKKLLIVTTTTGFRHSSIPTAEKVLAKLARETGAFTVDFAQQPTVKLNEPRKPKALATDADDAAKQKYEADQAKYQADFAKFKDAQKEFDAEMKKTLEKLSPENLKNYDGVVFANTTGDLPIPDREGFLNWLKSGKAFVGMHSCSDTFHGWPAFIKMLGGEFAGHGAQVGVECLNQDPKHPSTATLPAAWKINQ